MNRQPRHARRHSPPAAPAAAVESADARIIERPDGFWVQPFTGERERGPYATLFEARADRRAVDDGDLAPGDTLAEAEAQLGLSDWIDPETSEPAEDSVPHIEEH